MKTIIVANQKGGSGKPTLVAHLAVAAELAGDGPVIITDTDPQGSTADWYNARENEWPGYAPATVATLGAKIVALQEAGAALLFVDTAPARIVPRHSRMRIRHCTTNRFATLRCASCNACIHKLSESSIVFVATTKQD